MQPLAITQPQQTELTEKQAIVILQKFALERRSALLAYPNAKGVSEKLLAIDEILNMLDAARYMMPRAACVMILKTWLNFRYIAPTATKKLFTTWNDKTEAVLTACRNYLGYNKQ
ncbi:hypothetical protein GCM10023149_31080 [Mucilaginibacter gynuensis]|uniref:Uncharacterized protein n=1 Tax=Mucilaginibacter gynuensis TaxID=1302236 RepID=A0ABP8GNM3_9SPHI